MRSDECRAAFLCLTSRLKRATISADMPSFDVVTIGAATQDVFLQSSSFEEVRNPYAPDGLDACLPLGSKINLHDITLASGGGASNAAVAFARFGLKTACVTRVGTDGAGDTIQAEF